MRVIFQASGEEIAHETDDLIVIAESMSLLDRSIVFVDDNDGGNLIVGMEHPGQIQEDHGHIRFTGCPFQDIFKVFFVIGRYPVAVQQFPVAMYLVAENLAGAVNRNPEIIAPLITLIRRPAALPYSRAIWLPMAALSSSLPWHRK